MVGFSFRVAKANPQLFKLEEKMCTFFSEGVIQETLWSFKDSNGFCFLPFLRNGIVYSILFASCASLEVPRQSSVCYFQILKTNTGFVFHHISLFDSRQDSVVWICVHYENMYLCKLYFQSLVFPNVHHKDCTNYRAWNWEIPAPVTFPREFLFAL